MTLINLSRGAMTQLTTGDLLEFLADIERRSGGDIPVWLALLDAQGTVTRMPLMDIVMVEGPDHPAALFLCGPQPETAGQPVAAGTAPPGQSAEQAVRPKFLQGTLYGTPPLSYLLTFLNSPDPHGENAAVRTIVDALSTHGVTEETLKLFTTTFGSGRLQMDYTAPAGAVSHLLLCNDPWRLKRCVECEQYFFDVSRNGRTRFCTQRCTSRHTSRDYRRRTAHVSPPA